MRVGIALVRLELRRKWIRRVVLVHGLRLWVGPSALVVKGDAMRHRQSWWAWRHGLSDEKLGRRVLRRRT
eukprot:14332368-Alexandrium_andersonii.AAC.1